MPTRNHHIRLATLTIKYKMSNKLEPKEVNCGFTKKCLEEIILI